MLEKTSKWRSLPLSQIVKKDKPIAYGIIQAGPECEGGMPYIKSSDVGREIAIGTLSRTSLEIAARYTRSVVVPGDIVFSLRGNIGQLSIVPRNLKEANLTQGTARISVGVDFDAQFIAFALQAPSMQRRISIVGKGSTFKEISLDQLRQLEISFPCREQQQKIAKLLRTWDEALKTLEALRDAKDKQYDALAESLIFGRRRTKRGCLNWQHSRLGEFTRELIARNTGERLGRDAVMGVTKANGIVPMREQTIGDDLSRYKILPPRAFAYNPMRINVGSIAMSRLPSDVLVSPDYVLFSCIDGKLSPDYLEHLRKTHFWSHHVNAGGSGSVRMRIYYDDLASMTLPLPDYDEQLAIVEVLDTARREISLIKAEIECLARQKRGLMQKLLTGEWRVKGF